MTELKKIALKIIKWDGPKDTQHHVHAADVMIQVYFKAEELLGTYTPPPDNVTASYVTGEKSFYIGVPEPLLEAFLDSFESDLTEPGKSAKLFEVFTKGITYQFSPFEPFESSEGRRRTEDEDLWGFLRGERTRTYTIEAMQAAIKDPFRRAGIDTTDVRIAPQRDKKSGGITCVDASFTVNGLSPISSQGYYPTDVWAAQLTNIRVGSGYMSFECGRILASRLDVCAKCLRYTSACVGHAKGTKRAASTDTPQEIRERAVQARMDSLKRLKARRGAAGSSSSTPMDPA